MEQTSDMQLEAPSHSSDLSVHAKHTDTAVPPSTITRYTNLALDPSMRSCSMRLAMATDSMKDCRPHQAVHTHTDVRLWGSHIRAAHSGWALVTGPGSKVLYLSRGTFFGLGRRAGRAEPEARWLC